MASQNKDIWNPLQFARVGSPVMRDGALAPVPILRSPPADGGYTVVTQSVMSRSEMTGTSSYIYTDSMNRGALAISGSYGFSPLSQVTASIQGYFGQSRVDNTRNVRVDYHTIVLAGIEALNLNEMMTEDLIKILAPGLQMPLMAAYDAYANLLDPAADGDKRTQRLLDWLHAREAFFAAAGTPASQGQGLVVGLQWGAIGSVSMLLDLSAAAEKKQFGGGADFTYASEVSSVAIKAVYDGSRGSQSANAKASWSSYWFGAAVKDLVADWQRSCNDKSLEALSDVRMLEAPRIPDKIDVPSAPEFKVPKADAALEAKLTNLRTLKDLGDLKDTARKAAFVKAKAEKPNLTEDQFNEDMNARADSEKLESLLKKIKTNDIDLAAYFNPSPAKASVQPAALAQGALPTAAAGAPSIMSPDYVPLGIFVADWCDLFPWLSTTSLNDIVSLRDAQTMIEFRTMIQDLQTLTQLYALASQGTLDVSSLVDLAGVSRSFSAAQSFLNESSTSAVGEDVAGKLAGVMRQCVASQMTDSARAIYRRWCQMPFLRNCELGLGLLFDRQEGGANRAYAPIMTPWEGDSPNFWLKGKRVEFDPAHPGTFSEFADTQKGYPLIFPDGRVTIFCVVGDPDIIQRYAPIVFWTRGDGGLNGTVQFDLFCDFEEWSSDFTFTANPAGNALACPAHNVRAIPIPYEAARGGGWKGQAMGRNIASFKDLQEQLGDILNTVKASPRMTFRPGAPVGGAPNRPYLWQRLPTQYYGLFPKKEAMLGDVTNLPG